jgi:hypothetical protein
VGAAALTLGAMVGSETLTLSGTGTVASKNFGNGKAVTLGSLALVSGTGSASNYTFTGGTYTADITQANLTVTAAQVIKTYDGGTTATGATTVGTLAGIGAGETVGSAATLAFTNKDVGSGNKTVTASGLVIRDSGNADVTGNYNITYANNTTSTINPFAVNLSGTRTYDGTVNVGSGALTLGTLVGSETLTLSGTGTVASKSVGTGKAVSLGSIALVSGTGSASNYTFTGGTQVVDVTARTLSVTYTGVDKSFDGSTAATTTASDNRLAGDILAVASVSNFSDPVAGTNKPVSIAGANLTGSDAGNYILASATGVTTATITPLPSIPLPTLPSTSTGGTGTDATGTGGTGDTGTNATGTGGTGGTGTDATGTGGTGGTGTDATGTSGTGGTGTDATGTGGTGGTGTDATGTGGTGGTGTDATGTGGTGGTGTDVTGTGGTGGKGRSDTTDTDTTLPAVLLPSGNGATGGSNTDIKLDGPDAGDRSSSADSDSVNSSGSTGRSVTVATVRGASAVDSGIITVSVPKGTATSGTGFSFKLPAELLASAGASVLRITSPTGDPLPTWLKFDSTANEFVASAVPDGSFPMQILVTFGQRRSTLVISERNE